MEVYEGEKKIEQGKWYWRVDTRRFLSQGGLIALFGDHLDVDEREPC